MTTIETNRKSLNKQITHLRKILSSAEQFEEAITLFMRVHAQLHAAQVSQSGEWSYEDAILNDMPEAQIRRIPQNEGHSIAWIFWHLARIEDAAMNLLVAGTPQVLHQGGWLVRMGVTQRDSGNEMSADEVVHLSATVDIGELRAYRAAVGRRTREIVAELQPDDLKQMVDPVRLQRVMDEAALVEAASGIRDYWGKRNIAGLLLMPATRHNLVHLNEAQRLKRKRR